MTSDSDQQLLREYTGRRSEAAFAELVRRHVDLVYSAALRMVRDRHLAEDVTQGVFVALGRNAGQLLERPVLSGWLHRTAQNLAANAVRTEVRRRAREQEVAAMTELFSAEPEAVWEHIAPQLDAALGELSEPDRDALLLRYFERKSAHQMAQTLGISDEAAQKRVTRAVERLRGFFAKRGVTVGVGGLAAVITANAVQAAPVGLAGAVSAAAALVVSTVHNSTIVAATKAITMTTLQKALITVTLTAAASAGFYEARENSQLRDRVQTLQEQQTPFAAQIRQLTAENGRLANMAAPAKDSTTLANDHFNELLRLRAQVTRLKANESQSKNEAGGDPLDMAAKQWAARANQLRQKFEEMPGRKIPELQFLTDADWLRVAEKAELDTDAGVRLGLAQMRSLAKQHFTTALREALQGYTQANDQQLPADVSQLKPYFHSPVDDAILDRYQMVATGSADALQPEQPVIGEKTTLIDQQCDTTVTIQMNGSAVRGVGTYQGIGQYASISQQPPEVATLSPAIEAFTAAHNGEMPKAPAELLPFLTTPEQKAAFQKLQLVNPNRW